MKPKLLDSHCHLDLILKTGHFKNLETLLENAHEAGVTELIAIATTIENSQEIITLTENFPKIPVACGLHPLSDLTAFCPNHLLQHAGHLRVVALGETGLDYTAPRERHKRQQEIFAAHIEVSNMLSKPLVVHVRDAFKDAFSLIQSHGKRQVAGVIHCFTGDEAAARLALELGFFISFSGIVTFKNSHALREVVRYVPMDRILIETDAPYLAPVPYRSKVNHPGYLVETARVMAVLKGLDFDTFAMQTTHNSKTLFKIEDSADGINAGGDR